MSHEQEISAEDRLRINVARILSWVGSESACKAETCGARIWWLQCKTAQGARRLPFDRDGTPHHATCPARTQFGGKP